MHVVVVAYGPESSTRRAEARAHSSSPVVTSVSVVAAHPTADAAGTHPIGSDAVRRVAGAFGTDPVLLVHDDVDIEQSTIEALRDAVTAAPPVSSRPFELFVPSDDTTVLSCVAGRGRDIAAIGGSLVIPDATIDPSDAAIRFIGKPITHAGACATRLAPDEPHPAGPLLVASMIVRDEEAQLPDALASVAALVDRIDICDTGSVDSTVDIIRAAGGNVREIEWRGDFAWARNQALDMCRDAEFAILFDADERIVIDDPLRFRRWLRTWAHEIDGLMVRVDNDRGPDGVATSLMSIRISRPATSSFDGAVHEVLTVTSPDGRPNSRIVTHYGLTVSHLGYRDDIAAVRGKTDRNIAIARRVHEADPTLKATLDLARALLDADTSDVEAARLLDCAADLLSPIDPAPLHSIVHATRAQCAFRAGALQGAVEFATEALSIIPTESLALATAAEALTQLGRPDDLLALHGRLANRPPGAPTYTVPRNVARYRAHVGLAMVTVGRLQDGVEQLIEVMADDATGTADIIAAAVRHALSAGLDPNTIVPLLLNDATGQVTAAVAASVAPAVTSTACLAALSLGASHPQLAVMQISAALVGGDGELAAAGTPHIGLLDRTTRAKLADLARRKRQPQLADQIANYSDTRFAAAGGR